MNRGPADYEDPGEAQLRSGKRKKINSFLLGGKRYTKLPNLYRTCSWRSSVNGGAKLKKAKGNSKTELRTRTELVWRTSGSPGVTGVSPVFRWRSGVENWRTVILEPYKKFQNFSRPVIETLTTFRGRYVGELCPKTPGGSVVPDVPDEK